MGGITWKHQQQLLEIARVAYGSGLTEGSRGGRGYMGVFDDISHARGGSFTTRVVKFLTHKGETCTIDGKPLEKEDWNKISVMTSSLREALYSIAQDIDDDKFSGDSPPPKVLLQNGRDTRIVFSILSNNWAH